ncbi:hypothetical protein N7478_012521 [Penicillium angulare]|uniref:uncharacterized protein n=1 Tax=Penicillium angulare TaxID=116970 RepID=UPI002541430A|nr:uncharacterized protein N7478_012521 [Penicillium angulare]KAJ5259540.1 hypothetical protein N7478_012521 [Penicillium angulare]
MAYFLPSFFQKRLLKYALSRLGIVETDALDPDNLGIAWGQRSTVELRDIGLKLEKLATLLNLPTTCELVSARVQLLRITIPADIYSSGIICEVNGVHVHLRCLPDEAPTGKQGKSKSSSGSGTHGTTEGHILPTPSDLAESFLDAEPKEEKEELQAAISSQSRVLQRSSSFSDEEDEELGLGNDTLSLPSFVEGFLKGVVDRLQLRIRDVSVRVDMELKQDAPSKRQPEDKPDLVSGILTIGEIDVHDVSGFTDTTSDSLPLREGKRLVFLADINLALGSDPVVFANYSRFIAPSSPTTTMQSKASETSSRAPSPPPLDSPDSESALAMTRSTIFEPPSAFGNDSMVQSAVEGSAVLSHDGRFSDADSETDSRYDRYLEDSQIFGNDPFQDNPGYLDSVIGAQFDDYDVESPRMLQSETSTREEINGPTYFSHHLFSASEGEASHAPPEMYQSSVHSTEVKEEPLYDSTPENHPKLETTHSAHSGEWSGREENIVGSRTGYVDSVSQSSASSSEVGSAASGSATPDEGLLESKYFSHDEAQSLYMSAMSHGGDNSFLPNMPGAWGSSQSGHQSNQSFSHPSESKRTDNLKSSQKIQDETTMSTPKLTAPSDSYFGEQRPIGNPVGSQPEIPDRDSATSSPALHKMTYMRKPIFNIDRLLIWLPSTTDKESTDHTSPQESVEKMDTDSNDLAYGVEESMFASKAYASTRFKKDPTEHAIPSETSIPTQGESLEVEVFSITTHFDIATGWLLIKVGQLAAQMANAPENEKSQKPSTTAESSKKTQLNLVVREISIKFLEHLPGFPRSSEQAPSPTPLPYPTAEDVILQVTTAGLGLNLTADDDKRTKLQLTISKFKFGFASEDLISFDESLRMRESIRDLTASSHHDISVSLTKSMDSVKAEISTLPIYINLNVQRIEEVIGWMGGLSTILELGSSISSASTMKGGKKAPNKRPRGVHFEKPNTSAEKESKSSVPVKVNMRVGGIVLDIKGETHYLSLSTTAVKVVSRFEGIGIQIDKAELAGPLPLDHMSAAPANVKLDNIRVEFLFAPKEVDLERLLTLITPSQDKYDDGDDIIVDMLLRQRRQGSVLRTTVGVMETSVFSIDGLAPIAALGAELSRLSTVTKYLPEDDRPGILTLTLVRKFDVHIHVGQGVGDIDAYLTNFEAAWISMPPLIATHINTIKIMRNKKEELMGEALLPGKAVDGKAMHGKVLDGKAVDKAQAGPPVLMARFIPDDLEPTFKIKLHHLRVEYTIPSIMAFLGLGRDTTGGDLAAEMASSIANLADSTRGGTEGLGLFATSPERSKAPTRPMRIEVLFRDCVLGLNPRNSPAKGLFVLSNAKFSGTMHDQESSEALLDIRKASLMIIDDVSNVGETDNLRQRRSALTQSNQVSAYIDEGYVPVTTISSATAVVKIMQLAADGTKSLDVELRDDLLVLETCADSTQTLIAILNGLQPPTPPSVTAKYRTEVMPIQDMLASFTGDAFSADEGISAQLHSDVPTNPDESILEGHLSDELEYVSDFYSGNQMGYGNGNSDDPELLGALGGADPLDFQSQYHISSSLTDINFQDDHFAKQSAVGGTAHRWDSTHNTYGLSNDQKLQGSPLRVRARDMHVIWNLFDGYDWQRTRDTISKAVKDVEIKATERRARATRMSLEDEEEPESVIGDFLFNSIYIGIPANKDPRELHREINRDINDLASETGSYATTTTVTGASNRQGRPTSEREKKLRLNRSKQHKMTFELKGVSADLVVFPPGSDETQSSLDVRVQDLEIFDHVPTSTWKKFATYMHEAGERESGSSMVHLEILTVRPVLELAASEIVLKATVLPIRLIVDQDALEFMSRFFEFRDESAEEPSAPGDVPFLQRVEVNAVQVKLDFKPKRVDYAGLRSGRTTEFMNFFVLDGADMVLRHVIIYGVSGFDRLGVTLNDIWMPDVKNNQLPGVLAGLAPIRSLVNVGGGVRDLVVVPMREYRKDGRIVRSIQKGALSFAKTTSNELVKLGAKLAIGTQTVLQGAEDLLTSHNAPSGAGDQDQEDEEEAKKISLYADQPIGVVQGLRGAYRGLERDLLLARDAIVAVPGEVVESGSARAAAKAVWKRAPTVILRPAIGVSKAVGQTLLGAGNTLDPSNRRRMEDKYKHH